MEEPFRRLLLLLALALLLPAAAAGPQPCEPALLATKVARFCATNITSEHCCEAVVAAVDLHGGGRVAAEPTLVAAGINATRLLTVYSSCGGLLRPGRADLAAAASCQGTGTGTGTRRSRTQQTPPPLADEATTEKQPPHQRDADADADAHSKAKAKAPLASAAVISPAPHSGALLYSSTVVQVHVSGAGDGYTNKCAAGQLANQLVLTCDTRENTPTPSCCKIISTIMEQSCFCEVCEEPEVRASTHMAPEQILSLYNICGGEERVLPGQCGPVNPPPPPATLLQPPPSSAHRGRRISLSTLLPSLLGGFLGLLGIAYGVYRLVQWAKLQGFLGGVAPPPGPAGLQLQEQQLQQQRDAAASAAEERLARGAAARVAV